MQALFVEKALVADTDSSPEEIAKLMLIQSALVSKGVSQDMLLEALLSLIDEADFDKVSKAAKNALKIGSISQEEILRMLTTSKALGGSKVRGMKEIDKILEEADLSSAEGIAKALRKAVKAGCLDRMAFAKAALMQKALLAAGVSPKIVARAMKLQRDLADSGMPAHDIANAMSMTMSMAVDVDGNKDADAETIEAKFEEYISRGVCMSKEDIEAILALIGACGEFKDGEDLSPEAIRLFKKAMKQRRGSVDNVAETLMSTLSQSGESKENVAKAMVKALKATGATPEEIAKTMQAAMERSGASKEEIARVMAQAMADSGASGEMK